MQLVHDDPDLIGMLWEGTIPDPPELGAFRLAWVVQGGFHGRIDKWSLTRSRIRSAAESASTPAEFVEVLVPSLRQLDVHFTNAEAIELLAAAQVPGAVEAIRDLGEIAVLRAQVARQHLKPQPKPKTDDQEQMF